MFVDEYFQIECSIVSLHDEVNRLLKPTTVFVIAYAREVYYDE